MNFRDAAQAIKSLEEFYEETKHSFLGMFSDFPIHADHRKFMSDLREYVLKTENLSDFETQYLMSLLNLKEAFEITNKLGKALWDEKHPKEKR